MSTQPPPAYDYNQPAQQQMYQPGQQAGYQPGYQPQGPAQTSVIVVQQPGAGRTAAPGSCRHCGIGYPQSSFTICGIILAILFFPLGIICCLMLQETRCTHCHALL